MIESDKKLAFKESVLPCLDQLMQFALWLTKNGRSATCLMRESMAEAYQSWDQRMPHECRKIWLHMIITGRFFHSFQQHTHMDRTAKRAEIDDRLVKANRLFAHDQYEPSFTLESAEEINYFKAIATLPPVFRPAMILSYLEGFTNKEIAYLARVPAYAIESLLNRGRALIREELYAVLLGIDEKNLVEERKMASG